MRENYLAVENIPMTAGSPTDQLLVGPLHAGSSSKDTLIKGESLPEGQQLTSANGDFTVTVKGGKVVLSDLDGKQLWSRGPGRQDGHVDPNAKLELGNDGLGLYGYAAKSGHEISSANDYGSLWLSDVGNIDKSKIAGLRVTNDGSLVLLDSDQAVLATVYLPEGNNDPLGELHYPIGASQNLCHVIAMAGEAFRNVAGLMVPGTPTLAPDPWQLLQSQGLVSQDHSVMVDTYNAHLGDIDQAKKDLRHNDTHSATITGETATIADKALGDIKNMVAGLNDKLKAADGTPTKIGPPGSAQTVAGLMQGTLPSLTDSPSGYGQFDRNKERDLLDTIFNALGAAYTVVRGAQEQIQQAAKKLGPLQNPGAISTEQIDYGNAGSWPGGAAACRDYINQALDRVGITDPVARDNWMRGMLTIASRESGFNSPRFQVNKNDVNATGATRSDGAPGKSSRGGWQTIPDTFAANHQVGTPTNIYDPVANAAAAINYLTGEKHVRPDGSDLALVVQQADPSRAPKGY